MVAGVCQPVSIQKVMSVDPLCPLSIQHLSFFGLRCIDHSTEFILCIPKRPLACSIPYLLLTQRNIPSIISLDRTSKQVQISTFQPPLQLLPGTSNRPTDFPPHVQAVAGDGSRQKRTHANSARYLQNQGYHRSSNQDVCQSTIAPCGQVIRSLL